MKLSILLLPYFDAVLLPFLLISTDGVYSLHARRALVLPPIRSHSSYVAARPGYCQ